MRVGIYSHCTIDTIVFDDDMYEVPGGPACYCTLAARNQKFDVSLATKYGKDFPLTEFLQEKKINMENKLSDKSTTRFKIVLNNSERELFNPNIDCYHAGFGYEIDECISKNIPLFFIIPIPLFSVIHRKERRTERRKTCRAKIIKIK